jgi:hypothetical protein
VQRCCHIFSMNKESDHFLNNVKSEYEQGEQKRLMNGGEKQWLGFVLLADVCIFSYEDDFGDQGVDDPVRY